MRQPGAMIQQSINQQRKKATREDEKMKMMKS
jgi:hypothetical protein